MKRKLEQAEFNLSETNSEIDRITDQINIELPRLIEKHKEDLKKQLNEQQKISEETEELFDENK